MSAGGSSIGADQRDEARRFGTVYALGWTSYAVAFGLVVANEARTLHLAVVRWSAHVLLGVAIGLLVVRLLGIRERGGWAFHALAAVATTAIWAVTSALALDLATGSSRAFDSLLRHPGRARWQLLAGGMMYALTAAGVQWRRATERLANARAAAEQQSRLRTEAELRALRSRLDPHFLFNTLHSLVALARQSPEQVEAGLVQLASLLRYTLRTQPGDRDRVVFSAEWRFVQDYLDLERSRLGGRLAVVSRVSEDTFGVEIPPFTLQPLVENAIKHAVGPSDKPITVSIDARLEGECLVVIVADDGPGGHGNPLAEPGPGERRGIGLTAIRDRLALLYGDAATMEVTTAPGAGFVVRMRVPLEVDG